MGVTEQIVGDYVVLQAGESLTTGGTGEEFEQRLQDLFQSGHLHAVADLGGAARVDSSGIRALVRGYTTAQRLGGSFSLLRPDQRLLRLLRTTRLDTIFPIFDSLEALQQSRHPR